MPDIYEKAIVEKRNVLNELRCNNMTLQELRFFSIYLSKINPWDQSTRVVRFPLSDFQRIMGFGKLNIGQLKASTNSLLCKVVNIPDETGGYTAFTLFKKCRVFRSKDDEWFIEINASDDALPLMFDFKNKYFKYELWNALRLKSANQVRMYEILKQYEKIGKRELSVHELRELLGIDKDEYTYWQNFKVRVLDSCQQALKETTDICFTYERGKVGQGGKWLSVVFYITKNTDYIDQLSLDEFIAQQPEPAPLEFGTIAEDGEFVEQTTFFDDDNALDQSENYEDEDEKMVKVYGSERIAELAEVCKYEFDKDQMNVIFGLIRDLPIPPDSLTNSLHYGRVAWLGNMYNKFLVAAHQAELYGEPIRNRYKYFCRMVENAFDEN